MTQVTLIVLSYHRFTPQEDDYDFSRTYKQFANDLDTKDYDLITIDDGHQSLVKACKMMEDRNIRAKVFVSTDLIGQPNYCTWDEIWRVSRKHDIENHSHQHVRLDELRDESKIYWQIEHANLIIKEQVGRTPRYFVAPWNSYDKRVEKAAKSLGLQTLQDRINMKNISR